jgi:hypothetical protein
MLPLRDQLGDKRQLFALRALRAVERGATVAPRSPLGTPPPRLSARQKVSQLWQEKPRATTAP